MSLDRTPRSLHVLVADDEVLIVRAVSKALRRAGHVPHGAADAAEALGVLDRRPLDAAIVDHHMPGGGEMVLRALVARDDFGGPVILLTGDDLSDPELPRLPGVTRMRKPFDYDELIAAVEGRRP